MLKSLNLYQSSTLELLLTNACLAKRQAFLLRYVPGELLNLNPSTTAQYQSQFAHSVMEWAFL